jgi:hypothetical protein
MDRFDLPERIWFLIAAVGFVMLVIAIMGMALN